VVTLGDAAARGTGVVLSTQLVRLVLQFGSVVLLARLLTPEDFGLVAMVTAIIGIAEIIRDFGLSSAAVQSAVLTDDERTNLFWANLGLGTACAVVGIAATPLIVAGYGEPRLAPIVVVLSLVFIVTGANTQYRADLMRRMRYRQLATSDVLAQALAIGVALAAAALGAGLWAIVAQQVVLAVAQFVINLVNVRWLPGLPKREVSLKRFFRFGFGVLGTHGLSYLTKSAASIGIGGYLGAVPLGLYNRAYQLLMTPLQQIDAPMTGVILPVLSRVQDDEETFARYAARVQMVACYVTATVLAVAAGLAHPLTLVLFGEKWLGVVPIFAVLAIGGVFRTLGTLAYWIFLAKGRTGAQLRMDLYARPVMIAIMLGGLPWGVVGVAVGHGIAFFLYWTALRTMATVSLPCGLLAFATAQLLAAPPLVELVAGVVVAGLYLLLATATMRSVREDFVIARDLVRRAVRRGGTTS
jgi:PST family polysaccharide transporter